MYKIKPRMVIVGHMHKPGGYMKLGYDIIVLNPGMGAREEYAIIDTDTLEIKFHRGSEIIDGTIGESF